LKIHSWGEKRDGSLSARQVEEPLYSWRVRQLWTKSRASVTRLVDVCFYFSVQTTSGATTTNFGHVGYDL
jgi:hypothetical protein